MMRECTARIANAIPVKAIRLFEAIGERGHAGAPRARARLSVPLQF
jgi:hypothetical protein